VWKLRQRFGIAAPRVTIQSQIPWYWRWIGIAVHRPMDAQTLVVLAVEDNLVKGAAGQAIQNFNVMFGFDETTALL